MIRGRPERQPGIAKHDANSRIAISKESEVSGILGNSLYQRINLVIGQILGRTYITGHCTGAKTHNCDLILIRISREGIEYLSDGPSLCVVRQRLFGPYWVYALETMYCRPMQQHSQLLLVVICYPNYPKKTAFRMQYVPVLSYIEGAGEKYGG